MLAVVATDGRVLQGVLLLFIYAMGFAAPMLLVAYSSQWVRKRWFSLSKAPVALRVGSGLVLIALGVWIVWKGALIIV